MSRGFFQIGIIPALAGNTVPPYLDLVFAADHPRSRGEYPRYNHENVTEHGSSPLSRGIPPGAGFFILQLRIIPALAGNTSNSLQIATSVPDHPRSRGEYRVAPILRFVFPGSSPLSRGILAKRSTSILSIRIIPALAGNTISLLTGILFYQDHPRSRGEYESHYTVVPSAYGSSPLSRGIHNVMDADTVKQRIIPALAGNTLGTGYNSGDSQDHPRSRGEYPLCGAFDIRDQGSSPLSRGIPPERAHC